MGICTALIGVLPGLRHDRHRRAAAADGPADRCRASASAASGAAPCSSRWSGAPRTARLHGQLAAAGRAAGACCCPRAWCSCSRATSGADFDTWGWRVPFLLSLVLVGVGLYVRLRVLESPEFAEVRESRPSRKLPVIEVVPHPVAGDPRADVRADVGAGAVLHLHHVRADLRHGAPEALAGRPAERHAGRGRGRADQRAAVRAPVRQDRPHGRCTGSASPARRCSRSPTSGCSTRRKPALVLLAIVLSLVFHDMQYGPQAALIAESFGTNTPLQRRRVGLPVRVGDRGRPRAADRRRDPRRTGSSTGISIYILACCALSAVALVADAAPHASRPRSPSRTRRWRKARSPPAAGTI